MDKWFAFFLLFVVAVKCNDASNPAQYLGILIGVAVVCLVKLIITNLNN
jgi:hypothetical protein